AGRALSLAQAVWPRPLACPNEYISEQPRSALLLHPEPASPQSPLHAQPAESSSATPTPAPTQAATRHSWARNATAFHTAPVLRRPSRRPYTCGPALRSPRNDWAGVEAREPT